MSGMMMLPNGDLWTAPTITEVKDDAGNTIDITMETRKDNVNMENLPQRAKMTPDVAAILMNDLERARSK
jgi:hypothetical protein